MGIISKEEFSRKMVLCSHGHFYFKDISYNNKPLDHTTSSRLQGYDKMGPPTEIFLMKANLWISSSHWNLRRCLGNCITIYEIYIDNWSHSAISLTKCMDCDLTYSWQMMANGKFHTCSFQRPFIAGLFGDGPQILKRNHPMCEIDHELITNKSQVC